MSIFEIIQEDKTICSIKINNNFDKQSIKAIYPKVKKIKNKKFSLVRIDCSDMTKLDYAGALLLADLSATFCKTHSSIVITDLSLESQHLLLFARKNLRQKSQIQVAQESAFLSPIIKAGKYIVDSIESFIFFLSFLGESTL
ncbi:MAG: hypothetical protein L3J44_04395, partial [Campylobacteraceae bacterium]|nr:hypothetical protein [Campylobacteraceae bacterium]